MNSKVTRRSFVIITGAAAALAVFYRPPKRVYGRLFSAVNPPSYPKPGKWAFYSTTCRECPAGCGMLMWYRDGRVTKAEGNPYHPVNRGKLCIRGQSTVQGEYSIDRITPGPLVKEGGKFRDTSWDDAIEAIRNELSGKRLVFVSDLQTGSLAGVMQDFAAKYSSRPYFYEAFNYESLRSAGREIYGDANIPRFDISGSDLIVSFNADFLQTWLSPVEYMREYADIRTLKDNNIGRSVYFGHSENLTAINADDFFITSPGSHASIIYRIALRLREKGAFRKQPSEWQFPEHVPATTEEIDDSIIEDIATRIIKAKAPVILAGRPGDRSIEGINTAKAAYMLNELLGNTGRIDFGQYHALSGTSFKEEIFSVFSSLGPDNVLVLHGTNPAYTEPSLAEYIKQAGTVIYVGPFKNETSELAHWYLPSNYPLEDWGDYEPWKGTVSLMQPVMNPLTETMAAGDILLQLAGNHDTSFRDVVISNWQRWKGQPSSVENPSTVKSVEGEIRMSNLMIAATEKAPVFGNFIFNGPIESPGDSEFFLDARPSLYFYDGRLANRPWLQEIPDPVSNIVWESWADMNTSRASALDIKDGEIIRVTGSGGVIEVPVRLTDRISGDTIAIDTGQGHWSYGETANGRGVSVFSLSDFMSSQQFTRVKIEKVSGKIRELLYLNATKDQHDRELLRYVELSSLGDKTAETDEITMPLPEGYSEEKDLYKPHEHENHRWAMVIDLQRCTGCKACEAACYAENNIPVVGKDHCAQGLEMSWLKVLPYNIAGNRTAFLPLPCQHCDAAPCEPVCPVFASAHTKEGLNAQIYNRCIGTRYCSNNCPYKVRRFNWENFKHTFPDTLRLNPEVTVRERGVMEKCTFCVQRIRNTEYTAKKEQRAVKEGEIVPACAQTCPVNAIIFGDLLNPDSEVSRLFKDPRRYQLLHYLNTKPGVVYLKKIIA